MPTCCIKNCVSRTDHTRTKGLKFFRFPKETDIRQQWLDASQRNKTNIKIDSAHICNLHFEADCFQIEWTKPRSNVPAKQILRLKKGSIPTKLIFQRKRKETNPSQNGSVEKDVTNKKKKAKLPGKTGIPTYAELLQCMQEEQHIYQGPEQDKNEDTLPHDAAIKQQQINEEIDDQSVSMKTLNLLKKAEEDKNKLLEENQKLVGKNH